MPKQIIKGKCDICDKNDGFRQHNMQQCKTCGLKVHEVCHGIPPTTTKNPNWECIACASLHWDEVDGITQTERPTVCELCSITDGVHSMHPLYDGDGIKAKQIVLPETSSSGQKRRWAWVHSLCAFYVGSNQSTTGCVYSCDKYGDFEFSSVAEEDEDQIIHHFVIAENEQPWKGVLSEFRGLKCALCGVRDKTGRKIPIQCSWGDSKEIDEFRKRHLDSGNDQCYMAMHVGCARWMRNEDGEESANKRIFFYPGSSSTVGNEDEEQEQEQQEDTDDPFFNPVTICYCDAHAKVISDNKPSKIKKKKQMMMQQQRPHPKSVARRTSSSDNVPTQLRRTSSSDSVPTTLFRRNSSGDSVSKRKIRTDPINSQGAREKPSKNSTETALSTPKTDHHPNNNSDYWFPKVKDDIVRIVRTTKKGKKSGASTIEAVKTATTERKAYWKRITNLAKPDFKDLWKSVQKHVYMETEWDGLWVPNYQGEKFKFGNWDTVTTIDKPSFSMNV